MELRRTHRHEVDRIRQEKDQLLQEEARATQAGRLNACPHWFLKQDTLYPETGDFVATNGNKMSCFRIQSILFPDTNLPFLTMKSPETATQQPVSGYKVAVSGYKIVCFRIQSILFREPVWTGLY